MKSSLPKAICFAHCRICWKSMAVSFRNSYRDPRSAYSKQTEQTHGKGNPQLDGRGTHQ